MYLRDIQVRVLLLCLKHNAKQAATRVFILQILFFVNYVAKAKRTEVLYFHGCF